MATSNTALRDELLGHLADLHASLEQAIKGLAPPDFDAVVLAVCGVVVRLLVPSSIGAAGVARSTFSQVCSALLVGTVGSPPREVGILRFIDAAREAEANKQVKGTSLVKAREGLLSVVANTVLIAGDDLVEAVPRVVATLVDSLARESGAAPAHAVIAALRRLLDAGLLTPTVMPPRRLLQLLSDALANTHSPYHKTPSGRGTLLAFMGRLAASARDEFSEAAADELFNRLMYALDTAGPKEQAVVLGCFNGLSCLLGAFPVLLERADQVAALSRDRSRTGSALYGHLFRSIQHCAFAPGGTRISLDVPEAAHRLLARHAPLLAAHVVEHAHSLFEALYVSVHLRARVRARRAASGSLLALLRLVASLIGTWPADVAAAEFDWFVRIRLMGMLTARGLLPLATAPTAAFSRHVNYAPLSDVRLALQGCGVFAASMAAMIGPESLRHR